MNYIFLDEVQNIKDFQRLVDSLYIKKNCDVYITGSKDKGLVLSRIKLGIGTYLSDTNTHFIKSLRINRK